MLSLTKRKTLYFLTILILAGSAITWCARGNGKNPAFHTAPVKRGDLVAAISATGTVEPEDLVDVGAQVAGQIITFGQDENGKEIDYGSTVKKGMVLARIDDSLYAADVALVRAQVQQSKAGVQRAEADLEQLKAKLYQTQRDWERAQKLGPSSKALAETSYDAYKSAYETAQANVAVGAASVVQAKEAVSQAQAALQRAQQNLNYCTITSPVDGVIIDRRVNIGQTVVASLNAPSLFLIAKNLKRMQVWVSVNEADIGNIYPGQPVNFTVDAYPGRVFRGEVGKVRLNATMTQNVVTYTVEVLTDNADGTLLPYLTANAEFETGHRTNILIVPNAALRWFPRPEQVAPEFRSIAQDSSVNGSAGEPGRQPPETPATFKNESKQGLLWVLTGKYVEPIEVQVGLSDGTMTEVQGDDLKEGMHVITGEQRPATTDGSQSPFTPQMRRGR